MKSLVVRLKIAALMILLLLAFLALPFAALLWIVSGKCLKWNSRIIDNITDKIVQLYDKL